MSSGYGAGDSPAVHLGFWTNWSHGHISGFTLTLTHQNGRLLVSLLAIFVAFVGRSIWRIACYTIHSILSRDTPQDALYHQLQAILRNSSTASDGTYQLLRAIRAWRGKVRIYTCRLLPITFLAIVCSVLFALAGTFSSKAYTARSNEVLVKGTDCVYLDNQGRTTYAEDLVKKQSADAAIAYARQCYKNASTTGTCQTFVRSQIARQIDRNASCPFSGEICKFQHGNLLIDTGYINSHDDLGINAPPSSRFQYREVVRCAPLASDGFTAVENITTSHGNVVSLLRFYYGPLKLPWANETLTYQYPVHTAIYGLARNTVSTATTDYSIGSIEQSGFTPIKELEADDADLMLFFLSTNGVSFTEKTEDPWFSGTKVGGVYNVPNITDMSIEERTYYIGDAPANAIGCTTHAQFCNPNLSGTARCEPMRSSSNWTNATLELWPGKTGSELLPWLWTAMDYSMLNVWDLVQELGPQILLARQTLALGMQEPIPSNQWQLELESWHAASLASLQAGYVNTAVGTRDPVLREKAVRPDNAEAIYACQNQKVLNAAYSSFSVLGLALILGFGILVITIDQSLEYLVKRIRRRRGLSAYSDLEWTSSATLQLQRLAYEAIGSGKWSKADSTFPILVTGEKLSPLDIRDLQHPSLRASTSGTSEELKGVYSEETRQR